MVLVVKKPPANARDIRMRVRSLGQEDPLGAGMATHSSILAWEIPWTEEPGELQSIAVPTESRHDLGTKQQQKFGSNINNKQSFIPNNRRQSQN